MSGGRDGDDDCVSGEGDGDVRMEEDHGDGSRRVVDDGGGGGVVCDVCVCFLSVHGTAVGQQLSVNEELVLLHSNHYLRSPSPRLAIEADVVVGVLGNRLVRMAQAGGFLLRTTLLR